MVGKGSKGLLGERRIEEAGSSLFVETAKGRDGKTVFDVWMMEKSVSRIRIIAKVQDGRRLDLLLGHIQSSA